MAGITLPGDEDDEFYSHKDDLRPEAEKARADLKRNSEMGMAPVESEDELIPSVTPATFGETDQAGGGSPPVDRENRDDPLPEAP